jgi:hypothetical protein
MKRIIDEALGKLKSRVEEIVGTFGRNGLSPQSLSKFEHSLHGALGEVGRAVEQAVLEEADIERPAIEHGGMRHYRKYRGPQEYQCLFGKIEVRRSVYQANGERTLCPLEVNAGILHHHLTPAAAEFVAYSTAHMVPAELAEFCRRWQYLTPSETVIKHVAAEIGELSEMIPEIYEDKVHEEEGRAPEETSVVTISRDGTAVNIREEGWRHAQAGSISFYGPKAKNKEGKKKRKRLRTVYLGQMPEERTPTFDEKFKREIDHTLEILPPRTQLACLADGARGIWKYFENHPRLKKAVHINDFWHTAEKLSDVSNALFGKGTEKAKRWYEKYRRILKTETGGVDKVIHSIRYYKRIRNIRSSSGREIIRSVLRFLARNRQRMDYAEYRRRGLPIGSGVVEAACKTLVGHRFKRAGMRWSIDGGQKILNLRVAVLSNRWDLFWKCHEEVIGADRVAA